MPYTINLTNGNVLTTVADGTVDNTTSLSLVGKNYAGYGVVQNENYVYMLENFANTTAPLRPISGQIWYDSGNKKLKFYDGSNGGQWKIASGASTSSVQPSNQTAGDFWWDTVNEQLYTFNGSTYTLIGPQVAGANQTQMVSKTVLDTSGISYAIIEAITNGVTTFIISTNAQPFLLGTNYQISGFDWIHPGVTLAGTTGYSTPSDKTIPTPPAGYGISTGTYRFYGTATNSEKLGGYTSADFVLNVGTPSFANQVAFGNAGFTVGLPVRELYVSINGLGNPVIQTQTDTMVFETTVPSGTGAQISPLTLNGTDILPGQTLVSNIGSQTLQYNTIWAQNFKGGNADVAKSLLVGVTARYPTVDSPGNGTPNTIVVRDSSGNVNATNFNGVATTAKYADLAEKYLPDATYEPGTVMVVGGSAEVTASTDGDFAIGAVSTNPAYMMNSELEGGVYVALKGRVPVKVSGAISKGQQLVPTNHGAGIAAPAGAFNVFAVALEDNDNLGIKLVECVIL
jgi:hypothetical protein